MSGYSHWVTPKLEGPPQVPDARAVDAIVADLLEAGWIQLCPTAPYNAAMPFYYASFPGTAAEASARPGDPRFDISEAPDLTIRASHCRSVTVMVTDHLLLAPTAVALETRVACPLCGAALLPEGEAGMSRLIPDTCVTCAAPVALATFGDLSCFRFALVVEPWYPPTRGGVVIVFCLSRKVTVLKLW
jgi:hypothetical protein